MQISSIFIPLQWSLHVTDSFGIVLSIVEKCPRYGGVIFCHTILWVETICPLFGGIHLIEVSVNR